MENLILNFFEMPTEIKFKTEQKLTKGRFKSKSEIVYQAIHKAIIEGKFKPGEKLEPEKLAIDLEVSRMPIREAINRLQTEGLVDIIPHTAAVVATVDTDEIKDLMTVRSMLEGFAVRRATKRITEKGLEKLWKICKEMEIKTKDKKDRNSLIARNREFHQTILEACGNKTIKSICSNLYDSFERFNMQLISSQKRANQILYEHRNLVETIEARKSAVAEKLMRSHINHTLHEIINLLNSE